MLSGNLGIDPITDQQIQPVSVDLRLGAVRLPSGQVQHAGRGRIVPGEFLLGSTKETIKLGYSLAGHVHGKSTRARQGLIVHAAGLVDPGFNGQLTLEMFNMSSAVLLLDIGMLICQISFEFVSSIPERPYGHPMLESHYQHQKDPTPARF